MLVLVGAGGIGLAIARRLGAGKRVLLAGINEDRLQSDVVSLEADGYRVNAQRVDVALREVHGVRSRRRRWSWAASSRSSILGLSPVQASPEAILAVDLVGTAHLPRGVRAHRSRVAQAFIISSMAGYMMPPLLP